MSAFAGLTREQLRAQYVAAWTRSQQGLPLSPVDAAISGVVAMHPEYHSLLGDAGAARDYEAPATDAAQNPFLHMGLHLAIREQISVDRPPGIRAIAGQLQSRLGAHHWEHALMQILGEVLWEAQRAGTAPDERSYLDQARRLSKR